MIDDSGTINETLPSVAFENSIHNPFLNHINSFRSIQVPNTVYLGISLHPFLIQMQTTQIWYSLVRFRTALPAVPRMSPTANPSPSTSSARARSSTLPLTAKSRGNSLSSRAFSPPKRSDASIALVSLLARSISTYTVVLLPNLAVQVGQCVLRSPQRRFNPGFHALFILKCRRFGLCRSSQRTRDI